MSKNEINFNLIQAYYQTYYQVQNAINKINLNVRYFLILIYSL
jgi:hypothetical protein